MRTGLRLVGVPLLIATVGCDEGSTPPTFSVVDSAGIVVVTNSSLALDAAETWTLDDTPLVSVGSGVGATDPLFRITGVAPIGDSLVVVGLGAPPRALVFTRSGSLAAELGGAGDGPGEFLSLGSVVQVSPEVVGLWDPYRRRLSHFDLGGTHLRDVDLSGVVPPAAGAVGSTAETAGYTHLHLVAGGYGVFAEGALGPGPEAGAYRPTLPAFLLDPQGERVGQYGEFPGMTVVAPTGLPQPLGARTFGAFIGDRLVVGTGGSAEYRVISSGGTLLRIVRWPAEVRTADGAFPDRWNELQARSPGLAGIVAELPMPTTLPAHAEIVTSDEGIVFVSDYPGPVGLLSTRRADDAPEVARPVIPVPARQWLIMSDEGQLIAKLRTPEGFEPQVVARGVMWGVFEDALGVESVRAFEIDRPGAAS